MDTLPRDSDGQLTKYAWPGGYPVFYMAEDNGIFCADCARGKNDSDASPASDDKQWHLVAADVNWEDTDMVCDHCYSLIESAYGG